MTLRLIVLLIALAVSSGAARAFSCPGISEMTQQAMDGWWVPGLALGIVSDGRTVLQRTYGVRDAGKDAPVTSNTVFGIGSVAKSMTALSFAISDARNEISLKTEIRSVLPYFPAQITLKHLLSHTAGWPRHDALWYLNAYDSHNLPRKLALLQRFAAPGKHFQYNNVPFAAVGEFLTVSTGIPWENWIRKTVLNPAGMTNAVTSVSEFRKTAEHATGYFPADHERISLPVRDTDPVAPAGGIYASLNDMIRYVGLLASGGHRDGRQIVPADAIERLWNIQIPGYGLGMRVSKWRGEKLAYHPGAIDGYAARISILPARRAGVIVLSNLSGQTRTAQIVSHIALDCLVGAPRTDWLTRLGARRPAPEPEPEAPPTVEFNNARIAYAGVFRHPAYGSFSFSAPRGGKTLLGMFHGREIVLEYAGDDTWRLQETAWPLRKGLLFRFQDFAEREFQSVATPLADGPTYGRNAGPLLFRRIGLPSSVK